MKLSDDLIWRGLIKDKTFASPTWLDKPGTFYHGVDASVDSLTIGNFAALMLARRLMNAGWKAVILAGGATSLVGDPGGKAGERELQPKDKIAQNIEAVKTQLNQVFAGSDYKLVNNIDWLAPLNYIDFLRDTGKYFPMSELMAREFVTERLDTGISYAEFSYSLLQGYDYWHLFKNYGVTLQIGASDQWGNMLSGVPLIRKKEGAEVHAFCMPLVINPATGVKFGKSEAGAIWLDEAKTSISDFDQFWINVRDDVVEDYLKIFTLLPKQRIEEIMHLQNQNPSNREAQYALADEVTKLVHGIDGLAVAKRYRDELGGGGDVRVRQVTHLSDGVTTIDALVNTGLASSNSDARRVIESGGVYVNNQKYSRNTLEKIDFTDTKIELRRGKAFKDSALIELE